MSSTRTAIRWAEIVDAYAVRVVATNQIAEEEDILTFVLTIAKMKMGLKNSDF